jgi:hypothetical protein
MHVIKINYRATFEYPKQSPLNPSGWRCPGPVPLELFQSRTDCWKVRGHNGKEVVPSEWQAPSSESLMEIVTDQFERQLSPWKMFGNPGDGQGMRELDPEEIVFKNGAAYLLDMEERKTKR